ncbi:hypothetical protein ADL02_08625 [Streptomyces sp. NRRL WC-3723]|nr:hypothetical protein ADL02_08625 [Streptomyces sp. NRRL WC-3723]
MHLVARLVARLNSLSAVALWCCRGSARNLLPETENAADSHPAKQVGVAVLHVTREPESTSFYAGLGLTLSTDAIGIHRVDVRRQWSEVVSLHCRRTRRVSRHGSVGWAEHSLFDA